VISPGSACIKPVAPISIVSSSGVRVVRENPLEVGYVVGGFVIFFKVIPIFESTYFVK